MFKVNQLAKSFGLEPLFHSVTFTVLPGERVGLVGPNGCGKTTLLRILTGEEKADAGSVQRTPADLRVGYLSQGLAFEPEATLERYIARMEGDIPALSARIEQLAGELVQHPGNASLQQEYDQALAQLQQ